MANDIYEKEINGITLLMINSSFLDAATCDRIGSALQGRVRKCQRVVLDLRQVQFADSAGLGLLLRLKRETGKHRFCLVHVSRRLKRCLQRIPAERLPRIFKSINEALQYAGPPVKESPSPGPSPTTETP